MAARIRKGDRVMVLAGKDRGAQGEVLRVIPAEQRVIVQGVRMIKRHRKASVRGEAGIEEIEAPIHVSNVAHIDPKDGKPTRVGFRTLGDGKKVRFAKRSGEVLDR
jgi:large subunit ribosomal protein L24